MKKNSLKLVIAFFALIFSFSEAFSQKQISITDLGYTPGSRRNVVPAVQEAIKQCTTDDAVTIVFPKGRYDFWQDFSATNNSTTGIALVGVKNVTIDGDSSEFVFHGRMRIVDVVNSENIVLKNFSADWDFPLIYQGVYLNATDDYIELEFDTEQYRYVIENNKFFMTGEGWKTEPGGGNLFDRDTKEILYKTHDGNANRHLFRARAEEVSPGIVRFYGAPNIKPPKGTYTTLMVGRSIVGINMTNSKDIYLKDITLYHALSHGIYGNRSENITIDNTNMKINEQKGRVFSTIADASHFLNCRGLLKVINCAHTGQADDFFNVHGRYTIVDSIIDKNTLITTNAWEADGPGFAGEEIWFINNVTFQKTETRVIQSVERMGGRLTKVTFTSPLPQEVKKGFGLENKTWTAEVEIRNCKILRNNRARGILITTPKKVVIEDNYFSTAGTAILVEGDMHRWYESGANQDVTIRNNIFDNCVTSGCITGSCRGDWGEAIITVTPGHRPKSANEEPFHKNIRIENNIFRTFDTPLIHACSVRGLTFRNNEIIRTYAFEPYLWQKTSFYLDGCRDVIISGNKIDKEYVNRTIEAQHMKQSDIKSDSFNLVK